MQITSPKYQNLSTQARALIVDDNEVDRAILLKICERIGFKDIKQASDGKYALDAVLKWDPDIIFVDMHMPNMDGLQFCAQLPKDRERVVIMQTGSEDTEIKIEAFKRGVTDFITKPFDHAEITARITAHTERLMMRQEMDQNVARMRQELQEAQSIQHLLFPKAEELKYIKTLLNVDAAYYHQPASEMGGDYLFMRPIDEHRLTVVMVDVSGHGVGAALHAFALHALFNHENYETDDLHVILENVNRGFKKCVNVGSFATVFLGIINYQTESLHYAAAASTSPIIYHADSQTFTEIDTSGSLLGVSADSRYSTRSISFKAGDIFFAYSDALTESENANGDFLKSEDLYQLINIHRELSAEKMVAHMNIAFKKHAPQALRDDLSLLVIKS